MAAWALALLVGAGVWAEPVPVTAQAGGGGDASTSVADPALRAELLAMRQADQTLRLEYVRAMNSEEGVGSPLGARLGALDRKHTERMKEILDEHGWPGWSLVGRDGARAAWLLVQHADADRPFQKRALVLLRRAVEVEDASGRDLAFLTDRVRVAEGRPQVYGTQTHVVDCERVSRPIEDVEGVDARRAEVGLPPLDEYLEMRTRQLGVGEGCG